MDMTHPEPEGNRAEYLRLSLQGDDEGGIVHLIVYAAPGFEIAINGERAESLDFSLSPELAADIGNSLTYAALRSTPQGKAGAH